MEVGRRKSVPAARNVVAGSVWESRMKMDEVKGGFKVFNGELNHSHPAIEETRNNNGTDLAPPIEKTTLEQNQSSTTGVIRERRKTWKPESIEVIGSSPTLNCKIRLKPNKSTSTKSCSSVSFDGIEKNPIQVEHTRSVSHKDFDESCKDFGVCKEKTISTSLTTIRNPRLDFDSNDHELDKEEEEDEEEKVIEKKSFDVKEVDVVEQKPKKIGKEDKKFNQIYRKPIPLSTNVKKQPPLMKDHLVYAKNPSPIILEEESDRFPQTQNKFENIVDLVMWKDVARSAFVFGLGTFILISLSYTEDINLSLTSAISYMGLVYLAAIFFYKSIIRRGHTYEENSIHLVGEEEAILVLKLMLPYLNEILLKLKAIFSGDPATTMKLAVLLFGLARFGSFITIGKMVKLGFFGVFTLPKVCSFYSAQFTFYGKDVIQLLGDSWHSCSRKKIVAIVGFILVWNFSSTSTRIWAVFMLVVAVRYYQQSSPREEQGHLKVEEEGTNTRRGGRRQIQGAWANKGFPAKERTET
ncbi:Reticulon-like protein b21 [Thalictrum thalictroides]|uniref:Reticulon-like protein n=1 Tax=Thalictrum thalictroides TaxID=46969 RepID=A0A7J6UTV5_THATH|nr:Reticulon-like protein b21 [Thalictrum thalictroides]